MTKTKKTKKPEDKELERSDIYALAGAAQLDVRTIKKALKCGVASLRAHVDQDRLRGAAKALCLYVPEKALHE